MNLLRIGKTLLSRASPRRRHLCILCGRRFGYFLPYRGGWRAAPPLMRALDVIGSDPDRFACPWCGATDRERHLFLYFRASGFLADLAVREVLHFAPERRLSIVFARQKPRRYIQCDLYPSVPNVERVDMLAMPYPDRTFDLVIANHVLEHVADDQAAIREIARVLKPGGYAVLQTPFSAVLTNTWSDPGVDTDAARLQAFGQEDHVRLFGRDICQRFATFGLVSRMSDHSELLSGIDACQYGINAREPFFLFQRM